MPDVRMPDGTVIRNVPAGITKAQLNAKLTKNGFDLNRLTTPKQAPSAIENIPLVGGLLAPIADIPLSVVEGLSGTTKSIADVFGADNAVSDAADYVSQAAAALKSAGSREDAEIARKIQKDAEGKGVWEEVKAAARAFTYSPLESTASLAGSALPFIGAAVATGGTGAVPIATMAGLGAASGAGTIKGAVYDAVYSEFVKNGASEEDAAAAAEKAQEYGGENMDQIALGGAFGALASATGFAPQIARTIGANAAKNLAAKVAAREAVEVGARKSTLGGFAKSAVVEAAPEAVQGGQEQLAQNLALQREGVDVDTWKGVAGQAASEGIASLLLGGYGGAREARQENRQMLTEEIAQELDALPVDADEQTISEAEARFVKRGFPLEKATQVVENLKAAKEAIDKQAAELERARAERMAQGEAEAAAEEGTGPNFTGPPPVDTEEEAAMQRAREAEFAGTPDLNAQIDEYTAFVDKGQVAPAPLVESIARQYVNAMKTTGLEGVVAPERMAAFSQFVGNEVGTIEPLFAEQAPPTGGVKAQYRRSTPQPTEITPERADEILADPVKLSDFTAATGMDADTLYDIAIGKVTGVKYSRRGRPPSASTVEAAGQEGLFGALPTQEENRLDKFEEIQQRKLEQGALTLEEREAERQARADEFDALQQERAVKDEQYTVEFVKGVEQKLQSANPANTAYSVQVDETSPKPYRVVGPDGELFAASDNLQDFEAQAARLDPYTTPPMAREDIEADNLKATVATSMVQELTRDIDAARERGEIDNNQRTELIRQLERPDAYDKYGRPQDNIAKAEEEARAAMSKFRNTTGVEAKAAEAELAVANEKLTKLVNNRMLNPIRSKLRSMSENRQLEREGATSRVGMAKVQQKLGEMEGADTSAEQREQREAKIDIAEGRVSKYRMGEAQPGQVKTDVSKVRAAVDAIVSVWKGPPVVTVVQSVNDIADAKIRRAVMQDNATNAEGFVAPDGTVYLIADNLESVERAKAVLFHEALGHVGLEKLFRGELDGALTALYKSNGNIRAKTDAWLTANPDAYAQDTNRTARAVEEILAEMSENGQLRPTMLKRIAAIIRNFARRLGINLAISDADVEAILAAGHERVVNGAQESTLVKGMRYINAWHGSPHSFDRFSTDYMGSGEGAQAYGWGLYFGDKREVGEHYKTQEEGRRATIDGQSMAKGKGRRFVEYGGNFTPEERRALLFLRGNTLEYALERLRRRSSKFYTPAENAEAQEMAATLIELSDTGRLQTHKGNLYEVQLAPKEDEYMDWKEPINKQSAKVQKALESLGFVAEDVQYPLAGADVYNQLRRRLGSKKEASLALLEAGIRGNRYPDNFSRRVQGEGQSYNYVIFSDEDVSITAKYSRPKTTKQNKEKIGTAEASISPGMRRTQKSTSTNGIAEGVEQVVKGHSWKDWGGGLKDNLEAMAPPTLVATLKTIPTSGILNWFGPDIPTIREIDTLVQKMVAMKANILKAAEQIGMELDEFLLSDKDQLLAQTQSTARINEMAPDDFKSADDALANHPAMKEVEARILKNANDKVLAARIIAEVKALVMQSKDAITVKGDKVAMSTAMKKLVANLSKTAIDGQKTSDQMKQIAELTRRIRDTHALWDKLGELKNGHKLYKEIRAYYKDMFEAELALLDGRIASIAGTKEAKRLRDLRADMMREVMNPDEAKKGGDIFYNLDSSLFTKDYFPFMRAGKYYIRVSAAKDGSREREFYQFETAKQQLAAKKAIAKRLGIDPEKNDGVLTIGYDVAALQEELKTDDQMMKKIFDLVGKAKAEFASSGVLGASDFKDLTDSIYQTWLLSTPERSVRRRFMHAQEVVGFQQDILQNFASQASSYANQLSKLAYAGDIRLKTEEARDSVGSRPTTEQARLKAAIYELEQRAEDELNPSPQSSFINALNRASYFYYLTAPATAMLQLTSIPIRVVPRLWRDYGYAEGTRMWLKYMKIWNTLGKAKVQSTRTGIAGVGDSLDVLMPNILSSKLVSADTKEGKLLRRALAAGMERNVLETVQDTLIQNERETGQKHRTGAARTVAETAAVTGKAMGVMFQGMENISRQAAYFMAFELAYKAESAKNPGAPEKVVFDKAVTTALNTVRDTLGDYSNWERSRIMKNDVSRALFLFKMHPILQTKFLVGAMRDIGRGLYPGASPEAKAARAGAMTELGGVLMMSGVFGGLLGMPLYSVMALALSESFDEEDDEDVRKLMGLDPRVAYDSDIMFRAWLMDKFGEPAIGDVSMADILIHGPLGALSNTELSSRTSLDLKNMWFREAVTGDSTSDTVIKTLLANVAGGQMLIQAFNAKDNFAEGDMYGAMKKMAPAFIRSWVAAEQGEAEGVVSRKGDVIIDKNDITGLDTFRTISGFRPLKLARWQDYYITRGKNDKKIKAEKTQLLSTLDRKLREGDITSKEQLQEFITDEVIPFNRTYPDPSFIITEETIMRSLKGRADVRGRTVQGMRLEKKTAEKDIGMADKFRP